MSSPSLIPVPQQQTEAQLEAEVQATRKPVLERQAQQQSILQQELLGQVNRINNHIQSAMRSGVSLAGGTTQLGTGRKQNNNPGNIKLPAGGIDAARKRYNDPALNIDPVPAKDGGYFLRFGDINKGAAAIGTLLKSPDGGYNNLTVEQGMRRWSNGAYGSEILPSINGGTPISALDQDQLDKLTHALVHREGNGEFTTPPVKQGNWDTQLLEHISRVVVDPMYHDASPSFQRDTREQLYDTKVKPTFIANGKQPPDREAFVERGTWVEALHKGDREWGKYIKASALSSIYGLAEFGNKVSALAEFEARTVFDGGFAEAYKNTDTSKVKEFASKRVGQEQIAEKYYDHTWSMWGVGLVSRELPKVPMYIMGGKAVGLIAENIAADSTVGAWALKRAADAAEGFLIQYSTGDSFKQSAAGAGAFVVLNPVFRYLGGLIGLHGREGVAKSFEETIRRPLNAEESQFIDAINDILRGKPEARNAIGAGRSIVKPEDLTDTFPKPGQPIKAKASPEEIANRIRALGPGELATAINNLAKRNPTRGDFDPKVLYANWAILNNTAKDLYGEKAAFQFLGKKQQAEVFRAIGRMAGVASEKSAILNADIVNAHIQDAVRIIEGLDEKGAKDIAATVQTRILEANKAQLRNTPEEIAAAILKKSGGTSLGPGAASRFDPAFYNSASAAVRDYVFESTGLKLEEPMHSALYLWGLRKDLPASLNKATLNAMREYSNRSGGILGGIKSQREWNKMATELHNHINMVGIAKGHPEVAKHGIDRIFRSTNLMGNPTQWQQELEDIVKDISHNASQVSKEGFFSALDRIPGIKESKRLGQYVIEANREKYNAVKAEYDALKTEYDELEKIKSDAHKLFMSEETTFEHPEYDKRYNNTGKTRDAWWAFYQDKNKFGRMRDLERELQKLSPDVGQIRQMANGQVMAYMTPAGMKMLHGVVAPFDFVNTVFGYQIPRSEIPTIIRRASFWLSTQPEKAATLVKLLEDWQKQSGNQDFISFRLAREKFGEGLKTIREELMHDWQRKLMPEAIDQHTSDEFNEAMLKQYPTVFESLVKNYAQYKDYATNPAHRGGAMVELSAKVMAGAYEGLGLSRDSAIEFLNAYFTEIRNQHGEQAVMNLSLAHKVARIARQESWATSPRDAYDRYIISKDIYEAIEKSKRVKDGATGASPK